MLRLKFSLFKHCQDTTPKPKSLEFDAFYEEYLSTHDIRDEKDGPAFSGARFGSGKTRCNDAVIEISMGIFDLDNADPHGIRSSLENAGIQAVIVSTYSHTTAAPCFRVVIPFTAPIPAADWPEVFDGFNYLFDGQVDPKTKAVSQMYYLPACPAEAEPDSFVWQIDGEPFDALAEPASGPPHADGEAVRPKAAVRKPTGSSAKACPRKLAEQVLRELFHGALKYFKHQFYAYADGYWQGLDRDVDVQQRIMVAFHELHVGLVNQIVDNLQVLTTVKEITPAFSTGERLLCLNNGTLDLRSGKLLKHSPDHRLVNKMHVHWNEDASAPVFLKALAEIFRDDADREERIQFVLEWFGYCLVPDISQHKFLWLVGKGGNGKSIILNTLAELLGKDNVLFAMLERMGRPSVRAELHGKLCNISHEMSADATLADNYLKSIVGGDWIEAERKFQPSFSFQPYARIVASTNKLPYLKDTSDGFFRRAIILEFTRQFAEDEMDKQLQGKILDELDGILVLAVRALHTLNERGHFQIPPTAQVAVNKYRDESDSVRYFVKESCQFDAKGMTASALYEKYVEFAAKYNLPRLNVIRLGTALSAQGIGNRDSNGKKYWKLTLKKDDEESRTKSTLAEETVDMF